MGIGDWGLGIGDWGLGIGANPQSPNLIYILIFLFYYKYIHKIKLKSFYQIILIQMKKFIY